MEADVIVIGAGSAGATAAGHLASAGLRVLIVDRRPLGQTGARWVNAVPEWMMAEARVRPASGDELFKTGGRFLMAPVGASSSLVYDGDDKLLHVDMRRLTMRLIREATSQGARFEQARVEGVHRGPDAVSLDLAKPDGSQERVSAALVVDASGLGAIIRKSDPALAAVADAVPAADVCAAAEYQFEVADPATLERILRRYGAEPGDDLAVPGLAGGFSTLTLFTRPNLDQVGVLAGSIPAMGVANGATLIEQFAARSPWLGARLYGGRGAIPLRLPLTQLVAPRVALIGDAACQVYSAHGSGVGMGMLAANALAESVAGRADPGGLEGLKIYESRFHRERGGLLSAADALRRFSQRHDAALAGRAIDAGLLDQEAFRAALLQRSMRPSLGAVARIGASGLRAPVLAMQFGPAVARALLLERLAALSSKPLKAKATELLLGRSDAPPSPVQSYNPLTADA